MQVDASGANSDKEEEKNPDNDWPD